MNSTSTKSNGLSLIKNVELLHLSRIKIYSEESCFNSKINILLTLLNKEMKNPVLILK